MPVVVEFSTDASVRAVPGRRAVCAAFTRQQQTNSTTRNSKLSCTRNRMDPNCAASSNANVDTTSEHELWLHFINAVRHSGKVEEVKGDMPYTDLEHHHLQLNAIRHSGKVEEVKGDMPYTDLEHHHLQLDYYRKKANQLERKIAQLESTTIYQESMRSTVDPQSWGRETHLVLSRLHRIKMDYYTNKEMLESVSKRRW